jgi:hypothetical protein
MRLAIWLLAALAGFALAATFMDAPSRWADALLDGPAAERGADPPAISAEAEPAQVGRSLAARTRALEEFADRCAIDTWEQAEDLRDAAGRAELEGDRPSAQDYYDRATSLYDEARTEATLRREQGGCLDQAMYSEMPQPPPVSDEPDADEPEGGPIEEAAPRFPVPPGAPTSELPSRAPVREPADLPAPTPAEAKAQNDSEVELRARASALAGRGDPCAAAKLLREQGNSQRTLLTAREYLERCRRRPR